MSYTLLHLASTFAQQLHAAGLPEAKWQRGVIPTNHGNIERLTFWWRGGPALFLYEDGTIKRERGNYFRIGDSLPPDLIAAIPNDP